MTARCEACGTANPATSRFCGGCGSALGARCPSCGTPVLREFRFCGSCGSPTAPTDVGDDPGSAVRPARDRTTEGVGGVPAATVAERRHVSILFVDLVSFTSLAEGRDPEEVRDLLERYFATCRSIIARYGGTVEKFIGDAVMAMWGAPVAHEDDAERAVRAGIDLVAAVATLGGELGLTDLAARAGVVSGEAAVTVGAVGQGMVAGDVVNTASRLQASARPGTVLVDDTTHRVAAGSIAFEPAGDRTLRGKRQPIQAWEAGQVVALRRGFGRGELPEGPLVGRDGAFAVIKELLHTVREERSVRLVSVFGQAGVGKSRLIWELEKYVDGVVEKILWHRAGSPAYGEGLAFRALADMVRHRVGIAEGDRPAHGRRRLASFLGETVADERTREWIRPYLAALLGLGPAPGGEREEAFAAWRTFFERVADRGTTVLVFEDLHWADAGLLDFVEHLAEHAAARPILVLAVARPELLERRPGWGSGRRDHLRLSLDPLPATAMAELLDGLAPGLPADLAERILDRAAGVPLYAVEILRMLVDRGDLEAVAGSYAVRGTLERLAVPETLHALIAARLDGLGPVDHALLRDAAVLGQAFPPAALAAIGGTSEEEIRPVLHRLVHGELLEIEEEHGPDGERYRFAEWLVREIAYGTLALRDRRSRHIAAADYYERLGDPEQVVALATHLLAACRAGPVGSAGPAGPSDLETAALAGRAIAALVAAADRASALHSQEQALAFIEDALALTADDAERARLWERAAVFAQAAVRYREAEDYARRALDWHTAAGDRTGVARLTARLGTILIFGYQSDTSIAVVQGALDELGDDPAMQDDPSIVALQAGLARANLTAGRAGEAAEWADRALAGAERLGLEPLVADTLATKGAAFIEGGRTAEGVALLRAALTMSEALGLFVPGLRARNSLAIGLFADDPRAARQIAADGLEIARRLGFDDLAIRLASTWIFAALDIGEWDAVLETAAALDREDLPTIDRLDFGGAVGLIRAWRSGSPGETGLAELGAQLPEGDAFARAFLDARLALAEVAGGRPRAGLTYAEAAMPVLLELGLTWVLDAGVALGRAALWAGDVERLEAAIETIAGSGLRGRTVSAFLATFRAGLEALQGQPGVALDRYADAAALWRRLDLPFQLALCQLEGARLLPDGLAGTESMADEARTILVGLGADALLARLEEGFSAVATVEAPAAS